ncbi:uncharacterized protein LOC143540486 [Bidens hawaiensis]|uniref:uncharacterized protein LOC143540486 n=1 Tax=Bidens hawaiensis TaxID=980011 RepID=UPI0040490D47
MPFICGSFHSQEEDDYDVLWPFPSNSPTKPTRRRNIFGSRRDKSAANPYSDRGLDKFEALLVDLDKKRQEILTQKGSEDVSMVKFISTDQNEVQPIIIKLRDRIKHDSTSLLSSPEPLDLKHVAFVKETEEDIKKKPLVDMIKLDQCKREFGEWWKPSYYLPLFVISILVLLMFSGRSFAILCISIGWYLVPIVNEIIDNSKQPINFEKKERPRRMIK